MAEDERKIWWGPLDWPKGPIRTPADVWSPEREKLIREIEREQLRRWLEERGRL